MPSAHAQLTTLDVAVLQKPFLTEHRVAYCQHVLARGSAASLLEGNLHCLAHSLPAFGYFAPNASDREIPGRFAA